ncbi:MAG TPA: tetratricopeptide repeat protein [Bryobacteraceae bacterium]
MRQQAQNDDLVMGLVEAARAQPSDGREDYLRKACAGDPELFNQVWDYVQWEDRMEGFLSSSLYALDLFDAVLEPGELLDKRFRIVRQAGEGGMAFVYEAIDEKLEKRIAVKVPKAGFRKRLTPEVRHATEIAHDNICRTFEIHSASTDRGDIDFVTMEFLEGETLAERLCRGPLREREVREIALQLASGLSAAHRHRVIHGDLKSNNVILTRAANGEIRAVITDFGLASGGAWRPDSGPGNSGASGGTPGYMAPELWNGQKASAASDIYALGVIFYEMLSGSLPPERTKPPSVHSRWDGIIQCCLDPDPLRRYASVEEIEEALAPRSIKWLIAAAAGVVLACAAGIGAWEVATAPKEAVRLAVAPIEGAADANLARNLTLNLSGELSHLKGNEHTKFTLLPAGKAGKATHMLHASLRPGNGKLLLDAHVTDTKSSVDIKKWDAEYSPGQIKYIPIALAGVVTGAFHLPPITEDATVSAAARADYQKGMAAVRWDSKTEEAVAAFGRAAVADPDSPLLFAGLAEAEWFQFFDTKDLKWLDRAEEAERQAERRNPDLAVVHRILGLLIYHSGRYEQAIAEYQRAIELEPNNSDGYRRLGMAYEANGDTDRALASYQRAVEIEPKYYANHQALGAFWFSRGEYSQSAGHFSKAVQLAPAEPFLRFALGAAYDNLGEFTKAEESFRSALGIKETQTELRELGFCLMYQGKDREAIPYLERAAGRGEESYVSWMKLSVAYRRAGLISKSRWANSQGLAAAREEVGRNARNGRAHSYLAYFYSGLGDNQIAESEIQQALQLAPADNNIRWVAAATFEALGLRDKTIEVLQHAPHGVVADLSRWPDLADLRTNSRFIELLGPSKTR